MRMNRIAFATSSAPLTRERLTRYLGATGHDLSKALELYEYNL